MSFSSQVKKELCQRPLSRKCCAQAEAYGVLLFCNTFSGSLIRITTLSRAFAYRLPELFRQAFDVSFGTVPDVETEQGKLTFLITNAEDIRRIRETFGDSGQGSVSHHINYPVLEEECCKVSFFRGVFLAGGSVTDPEKRYHLEVVTSHFHVHRELQALLPELALEPRETTRKANYVTYFKQNAAISKFLSVIGAENAGQAIRDARQQKSLVNGVNRQSNCDLANVEKAVQAAQSQIDAIRRLEDTGAMEQLPEKLQQTAQLRVEHPELSLIQLCELCQPPVSKSCLNHRLRKLLELSGQ